MNVQTPLLKLSAGIFRQYINDNLYVYDLSIQHEPWLQTIYNLKLFLIIIQVNINGDISFGQAYSSYTPITFPMSNGVPLVAVYLTDLHTARTGDEEIYYREDNTTEILEVTTSGTTL